MDNDKYDLHTIDYSIQGWDAIMAADMEIINAMIPTRIIGTLGETVVAYNALYLEAADSKWYKAQADGVKQPCHGLAVEGGIADDEIRIHRMGEIINAGWAWATIGGPIYLDPSTAGALTQILPGENIQIIGYALSATKMLMMMGTVSGGSVNVLSRGGAVLSPTTTINIIVWRAPYSCTVTNVRGYRVGGTGATINARRNGADNHLSSALSLTSADTWMDGGAVQNTAYVAGDKLEIMIVSVDGTPSQIAIQVDFSV